MATASTARLLSGEAPKAADIARADTDLTSLEEGRGLSSSPALDEPLRMSSLRSTNGDSDRPDADGTLSPRSEPMDVVPDLPDLVALTPQLIDMLRSVHVAYLIKHFAHFCSNVYFQPSGPLMLNARAQLKACQGAGVLPLQSLSKGEKWTVSTIEDKELRKSVLRSWETYWAGNSTPAELKRMVTKDMQKQVRGVVHGQTDLLRQICFLEDWGSHFPNSSFPSPAHLIRGFETQGDIEPQRYPPTNGVNSNFPLTLSDFNPREQALEAVSLPSQFSAHAQALFTHIAPNFTLRDVMEEAEQDDTRELRVRDPQAQPIVVRLLSGTSKFVAEKALPHAVNLLEELLAKLKIDSERWTEKDAWAWVDSMEAEGEPEGQVEEWQRATRPGPGNEEKTRQAQALWRQSWEKIAGAREQSLVKEQQAEDHEAKNEYKEAIASWTAALEADPRSEARIRYKRANCYRACEQLLDAEKDFVALIDLKDPGALQFQVLARPTLKRMRQKMKASGTASSAAPSDPTSPDPSGLKSASSKKASKKKKKGSVDASAAIEMVEMGQSLKASENVLMPVDKEVASPAPASPDDAFEPSLPALTPESKPASPAPKAASPASAALPAEPSALAASADKSSDAPSESSAEISLADAAFPSSSSPAPAAELAPSTTSAQASPPTVEPTSSVPRGLPIGTSALVETFSSASSTISSSSSSMPPLPSSSTSVSAETAINSPATPRSDKRDLSHDRGVSPRAPVSHHSVDPISMAPQGRMLVERPPSQQPHMQHQLQNPHQHPHQHPHQASQPPSHQQQQQWREQVSFYPPPFPQHPSPYPMYHPHHPHHPPPPHQHPNGYPMFRQEQPPPPQELSFASLATPGPFYQHQQHYQGMMPPPQPFYHLPAPPPPPPPQQQQVYRDPSSHFNSPRMAPPRPIQIQKPPPPPSPAQHGIKPAVSPAPSPALPAAVPNPPAVTSPVVASAALRASISPPPTTPIPEPAAVKPEVVPEPPPAPLPAGTESAPAAREKQPAVPMEFEDGILLFVCADWAATGSCPDESCSDLHERGIEVDYCDPQDTYTYPAEDPLVPTSVMCAEEASPAATTLEGVASGSATPTKAASPAVAEVNESVEDGSSRPAAEKALPALLVTPAAASETASPLEPAPLTALPKPVTAAPTANGVVGEASAPVRPASPPTPPTVLPASQPAPVAIIAAALAPKAAKKPAAAADRWWEKGANATSTVAKEDDWATAGKKPKKPPLK